MLINTQAQLDTYCQAWLQEPYIALDTEFVRGGEHYWPQLSLIQICGATHQGAIDVQQKTLSFKSLIEVLQSKTVIKVIHSAKQDLEAIAVFFQVVMKPVFDSQIAAHFGGSRESVSYHELVQHFLNIHLDKRLQFSNWGKRPLSAAQIAYALSDVTYLYQLYPLLTQKLSKQNRLRWVMDECEVLVNKPILTPSSQNAWKKIKTGHLSGKAKAHLKLLAKWREDTAAVMNVAKKDILNDETLLKIAKYPEALDRHVPDWETKYQALSQKVRDNWDKMMQSLPLITAEVKSKHVVETRDMFLESIKLILHICAVQHNIEPLLICNRDTLTAYAQAPEETDNVPFFSGWRYDIFGRYLEGFIQGKMVISLDEDNKPILKDTNNPLVV